MQSEIVLPTTSPETEWIRGRAVRKVSPKFDHARVQTLLAVRVDAWARNRGVVGTEWRFRVRPPGERRRPLVPDLAYVAFERIRGLSRAQLQAPPLAPDVAFEILSKGDKKADVASKIDVYLRSGSRLVVIVDPARRTFLLSDGGAPEVFANGDTVTHAALPGLAIDVDGFFEEALHPQGLRGLVNP